jgi:2-polyprenyl-3-methyl-5-hydroxy-6-metoxy-1,4-benzoquinol methylase
LINKPNKTFERLTFNSDSINQLQKQIFDLHIERYEFASEYVFDKNVLDIACGVGYGSKILADNGAKRVLGIDISKDAIDEANALFKNDKTIFITSDYKYVDKPLICSALNDPTFDGFDVIISFETIEHLERPDNFLEVILKFLKVNGKFIISVPVTPSMDANPFHLHDFTNRKMQRLLNSKGLLIEVIHEQVQHYNPLKVKKDFNEMGRNDLRKNLLSYYLSHPLKFFLRLQSTIIIGFNNIYNIYVTKKAN